MGANYQDVRAIRDAFLDRHYRTENGRSGYYSTCYEVIEEVRKYFKDKVFNTLIPRLVRLVEAPSHGMPINEYDPSSRATLAYQNLAKEVISRNGD